MDFYFQSSFLPPPQHCVRTKGSALTFTDRVHSSDGSASLASVHVRMQSHTVAAATAATCPYALAHFPACFREGGRGWTEMREGLRMGLKKRKWGKGQREKRWEENERERHMLKWRWREAVEEDVEWGRGDSYKNTTVRWQPTDGVDMDAGQQDWLTHFVSCYRKTHGRHKNWSE